MVYSVLFELILKGILKMGNSYDFLALLGILGNSTFKRDELSRRIDIFSITKRISIKQKLCIKMCELDSDCQY